MFEIQGPSIHDVTLEEERGVSKMVVCNDFQGIIGILRGRREQKN